MSQVPDEQVTLPVPPEEKVAAPTLTRTASLTAVEKFLHEHSLADYCSAMRTEGYDDIEDLMELVLNPELLERIVPKPGHRSKLQRLLAPHSRGPAYGGYYPQSSRSTMIGDTDDDAQSISGVESVVSYQSRVVPRIRSYPQVDDQQPRVVPPTAQHLALVAPTPSPSPQRTDLESSKSFLADPQTKRIGGRALSRSPAPQSGRRRSPSGKFASPESDSNFMSTSSSVANLAMAGAPVGPQPIKMKVVVVGQAGCGKTSLISRLVHNVFSDTFRSTIGVEFAEKKFAVGSSVVSLHFWDIWGQENTMNATRSYYTGARGAVVVYDCSNEDSLNKAILWKQDLDSKVRMTGSGLPIPVILVGNKYDLAVGSPLGHPRTQRATPNSSFAGATSSDGSFVASFNRSASSAALPVDDKLLEANTRTALKSKEDIQRFCNEHRFAGHFFTSAKTGESVRAVAEYLVLAVLKMDPQDTVPKDHRVVTLESAAPRQRQDPKRSEESSKKRRCAML